MQSTSQTICSRCIMDTSVDDIEFDQHGVCNYCHQFSRLEQEYPTSEAGQVKLEEIINRIKREGQNKEYDCLIGVSGGTDSTYTLLMAVERGLRPLAVHFDNGWNSEIAVSNIHNAVSKLGVDLETYVVDWEEFRDIQLSFLKASVPEVEIPTDLAIRAVLYQTAAKLGIKYIINGNSFRAEGIVPKVWGYKDGRYLKSVHQKHGSIKLNTYPNLTLIDFAYYIFVKKIELVRPLNYMEYDKKLAKVVLGKKLEWTDYGGHHHESIFTRFFQSFLAPIKFNMDRRRVTLSALIRRGKISREEALLKLGDEAYINYQLERDMKYISKKFGISKAALEELIARPPRSFRNYKSYYRFLSFINPIIIYAQNKKIRGVFQGGGLTNKLERA